MTISSPTCASSSTFPVSTSNFVHHSLTYSSFCFSSYGDEEPKKTDSGGAKPAATANGTGDLPAKSATSTQPALKTPETTTELRTNTTASTTAPSQQCQEAESTEISGNNADEGSKNWEPPQVKQEGHNGNGNEYQKYNGYDHDGEGYPDYSGGGGGNMVDVGGSTAIKEDGCVYDLLAFLRHYCEISPVQFSFIYLKMFSQSSTHFEARGGHHWGEGGCRRDLELGWGKIDGGKEKYILNPSAIRGINSYTTATTTSTSTTTATAAITTFNTLVMRYWRMGEELLPLPLRPSAHCSIEKILYTHQRGWG